MNYFDKLRTLEMINLTKYFNLELSQLQVIP